MGQLFNPFLFVGGFIRDHSKVANGTYISRKVVGSVNVLDVVYPGMLG